MRRIVFAVFLLALSSVVAAQSFSGQLGYANLLAVGDTIEYSGYSILLDDYSPDLAAVRVTRGAEVVAPRTPLASGEEIRLADVWIRFEGNYYERARIALVSPGYTGPSFVNESIPVIQVTVTPSPTATANSSVNSTFNSSTVSPTPRVSPSPSGRPTYIPASPRPPAYSVIVPTVVDAREGGSVLVADEYGEPAANVSLELLLPDGTVVLLLTGPDGVAVFDAPVEGDYSVRVAGAAEAAAFRASKPGVWPDWLVPLLAIAAVLFLVGLVYVAYRWHAEGYGVKDAREYAEGRWDWFSTELGERIDGLKSLFYGREKAQTSLEYIFFLGASILVIVIVVLLVRGSTIPAANTELNGSIRNVTGIFNNFNVTT
ncbi:hypothetical protein AUJ14_05440 [Candidatus Micrarchaeota archaeon CG1_02_55_22]|nr:MAG: hypothetical protein AUJ14_05440 [Candidatus Micrarchaeota archaeon CG1_02_55_22]